MRVRDDKRADEATGPDVICQLFSAQTRKMATAQEAVAARTRARPAAAGAGCGGGPGRGGGCWGGSDCWGGCSGVQ